MESKFETLKEIDDYESKNALTDEERRALFERRMQIVFRIRDWREENKKLGLEPTISDESYVDDSKIYLSFSFKDINVAEIQLTDDLRRIAAWCCSNSLLANPEKTKLLLFGTPQMLNHVQNFRVTFLDKELQPVFSARDLGVEFDGCLSYDEHITQGVSKCTKSLCLINRVKHILDSRTLIVIINALVFMQTLILLNCVGKYV